MSEYTAQVEWQRDPLETFTDNRYSRRHLLRFDGGVVVAASSSPAVVPLPLSDASAVDPEEMFVAALASCHMLWFLSLAARQGWRVDRYDDEATGTLARNAEGRHGDDARDAAAARALRRRAPAQQRPSCRPCTTQAHEACFIANSVTTEVRCEPRP